MHGKRKMKGKNARYSNIFLFKAHSFCSGFYCLFQYRFFLFQAHCLFYFLGDTSTDANEIVECDGCGIAVHEGCYGIGPGAALVETGSVASTVSSASTEPWFCEPCRAGLKSPPK